MSFSFQWPRFSDQFHADAIEMLNSALNKGTKPPVIADKIEVVELEMGTQPPELEIRDIGELTTDQFRGIFRLTYAGDAHLVLRTKVQANPLNHKQPDIHLMTGSRGMLAAKQALVVPMLLRLSHFRLSSYVVLVVSKQKGITLVFKTDPLQNVDINSTFDSIAVIQKFIQREIEGQLRQMFREDLPGIIHRLSQQWVKSKVEAPYLHQPRPKTPPPTPAINTVSLSDLPVLPLQREQRMMMLDMYARSTLSAAPYAPSSAGFPYPPSSASVPYLPSIAPSIRPRSPSAISRAPSRLSSVSRPTSLRRHTSVPPQEPPETSFPDLENFDPTYGLRPEGLPTKSVFGAFGRLFAAPARGLADLAEDEAEDDDEADFGEAGSYGMVEWEDTIPDFASALDDGPDDIEFETIPAVGGGTITRPRVFHSQSQIHPPSGVTLTPTARAPSEASSLSRMTPAALARLQMPLPGSGSPSRRGTPVHNPYFPPMGLTPPSFSPMVLDPRFRAPLAPPTPPLYHSPLRRARSPAPSTHTQPSGSSSHSLRTPPSTDTGPVPAVRRNSVSSNPNPRLDGAFAPWPGEADAGEAGAPKIVLRPALNASVSRLATLSHSNHTLSPYTRVPEHFAVRSGPRERRAADVKPVRARRKRLVRLGGRGKEAPGQELVPEEMRRTGSTSPVPPSEFGEEEMDRYFRARDGEGEEEIRAQAEVEVEWLPSPVGGHGDGLRRRTPYRGAY
ncbi:hypothetical protein K488DRAFT_74349 [Vararia minispora EC-137]|uniref:Uncharacterized protein n=1 Tax=Vararia minispora EC-137 TaxID=1314806 RepID=A0ACB8Q7C6_9AGAM|nr:hypothetical protein K488DRAFT_74349 [Vararia minispora EC-137]